MTDIAERLHVVRDHLRTGRFGQREVWEEWLTETAAEITRLGVVEELLNITKDDIERLRALALAFLDCQTDENAEALRRVLEPKP